MADINQAEGEEKACRICLVPDEEAKLIRPCKCRSYVHRECLDRWRALNNANAYFRCEVCHFEYQYRRVILAMILRSPIFRVTLSLAWLVLYGYITGYTSANIINTLWSYFMHQPYYIPHNLQMLFYGLVSIALPGVYLFIQDIMRAEIRPAPAASINLPNIRMPYIYTVNPPSVSPAPVETIDEKGSVTHIKENITHARKKVAPYQAASVVTWILVGLFACRAGYYTYNYISEKINRYCAEVQELVENVRL